MGSQFHHGHVSSSRLVKRSVRISRTPLSCLLHLKGYEADSAFALRYILRRRSCRLMGAFIISPLPPMWAEERTDSRVPLLGGHYSASSLLRTPPPPSPLRPTSRVHRLYGLPCSAAFATGGGGLLQLLGASLSPCCRYHPAGVEYRASQRTNLHAAFALRKRARPPVLPPFEATCAFACAAAR